MKKHHYSKGDNDIFRVMRLMVLGIKLRLMNAKQDSTNWATSSASKTLNLKNAITFNDPFNY